MTATVAILCYNQADIIGQTVASARSQTVTPNEIIVVDDGSTDTSLDVLAAIPGIKVVSHGSNRGRTATRNSLLTAASGDIVLFLDGDTVAKPDLLANLLPGFSNSNVAAVGGQGIEMCRESVYDRWRAEHAVQSWGTEPRSDIPWLFGLCSAFRRTALLEAGGFYGYSEDQQIGYALRDLGYQLRYLPDAMVEHRRHDNRETFEHMLYRWWRGGYVVESRWGRPALRRLVWELIVNHSTQFVSHIGRRDWPLAWVGLTAAVAKIRGMKEGIRLRRIEVKAKSQLAGTSHQVGRS